MDRTGTSAWSRAPSPMTCVACISSIRSWTDGYRARSTRGVFWAVAGFANSVVVASLACGAPSSGVMSNITHVVDSHVVERPVPDGAAVDGGSRGDASLPRPLSRTTVERSLSYLLARLRPCGRLGGQSTVVELAVSCPAALVSSVIVPPDVPPAVAACIVSRLEGQQIDTEPCEGDITIRLRVPLSLFRREPSRLPYPPCHPSHASPDGRAQ